MTSKEDGALSPHKQDRVHSHERYVRFCFDRAVPLWTEEQMRSFTIRRNLVGGGNFNLEYIVAGHQSRQPYQREKIAGDIAKKKIRNREIANYISSLTSVVRDLSVKDEGINPHELDRLVAITSSLDQANLLRDFSSQWKKRFLTEVDDETVHRRSMQLSMLLSFRGQELLQLPPEEVQLRLAVIADAYAVTYETPPDGKKRQLHGRFRLSIDELLKQPDSVTQIQRVTSLYKEILPHGETPAEEVVLKSLRFAERHRLPEDDISGLIAKLLPRAEADPLMVSRLKEGSKGDLRFDGADFIVQSYAKRVSPANINELQMLAGEIPTPSHLAQYETVRQDALRLLPHFPNAVRELLHHLHPQAHAVVSAMVAYYETEQDDALSAMEQIMPPWEIGNPEALRARDSYNVTIRGESLITVLRRLKNMTTPESAQIDPPETADAEFNRLLQQVHTTDEKKSAIHETLDYTNEQLTTMIKQEEVGIDPDAIYAYGWLGRQCFNLLSQMPFEDQLDAYKQKWFQSILRFQELTYAAQPFQEEEFEQFLTELSQKTSWAEAYQMVSMRTQRHIDALGTIYREQGHEERVGALWSGNIAHELISLTDLHAAETAVWKKIER